MFIQTTKINRNSYKDIDIYYIGYITIKKFGHCENIDSEISLYWIIYLLKNILKKKKHDKYLILNSTDKYEKVLFGFKSEIKAINGGKELFDKKIYAKIVINADDHLPSNKPLKFPVLTIIINCIEEGEKLYQ